MTEEREDVLPTWSLWVWRIVGACVGVVLLGTIFAPTGNAYLAILGLAGSWIPGMLARISERWRAREEQRELREFLGRMRLASSLGWTLSRCLMEKGAAGASYRFRNRVIYHTERLLVLKGPEAVFQALAEELNSSTLRDVVQSLHAAREGGLALEEAFRTASDRLEDEATEQAELAIEQAPLRLVLPMLAGLFPAVVILILFPMAMATLSALSETGVGVP